MDINKPPSFEGWLHMKIVLYVLKMLFFFGWFLVSFVLVNKRVDVVLAVRQSEKNRMECMVYVGL